MDSYWGLPQPMGGGNGASGGTSESGTDSLSSEEGDWEGSSGFSGGPFAASYRRTAAGGWDICRLRIPAGVGRGALTPVDLDNEGGLDFVELSSAGYTTTRVKVHYGE